MSHSYKKRTPPKFSEVLAFLRGHFGKTPWLVFWAFFAMFFAAITSVSMPLVWAWFVNTTTKNVPSHTFDEIVWPIASLIALSILHHIFVRTAHFINCITDTRVHADIAADSVNYVHSFETE